MSIPEERVSFLFDYSSTTDFKDKPMDQKYKSAFTFNRSRQADYESSSHESIPAERFLAKYLRYAIAGFCYIMLICTFPISFPLCVRKVPSLERLVVFRLGKIEKVKGPGFVLIMPCIDHWIKVDLHAQTYQTPKQQLLTIDGAIMEIGASVRYQIVDVVQSVLQVDSLDSVFKQLVAQCLSTAVTQRQEEDVTRHTHVLQLDLQNMLNKSTVAWGLEVMQVDIPPVQILKAAEERNGVSALMSAFNTAMGGTQQPQEANGSKLTFADVSTVLSQEGPCIADVDQAFSCLSKMMEVYTNQGTFGGQEGIIRLEITDARRNFYLTIKNGTGDLYEDLVGADQAPANVTLSCTAEVLIQMLRKRLTPVHAYSNGLISLDGDWTMLKNFAQLITNQQ